MSENNLDVSSSSCASAIEALKLVQAELVAGDLSIEGIQWFCQDKLEAGLRVLLVEETKLGTPENWYFLGDIHGDFFALHTCVEYIKSQCPDFNLVFLGDLVDRGPHSAECFLYLISLAKQFPGRISWIAGNHDVGVHRLASGEFHSTVSPSEFIEVLNPIPQVAGKQHIGDLFVSVVAGLPRAIIMPTGLFVTHGGFPHSDLQKQAATLNSGQEKFAWLNTLPCLQDITWTRITKFPKKIPNRESTGCSYGFMDFKSFAELMSGSVNLSALLTGHEHPYEGFDRHETWLEYKSLTLTGFGFANEYTRADAYREKYRDNLFVGRMNIESVPEVISIPVDRGLLEEYFQYGIAGHFVNQNKIE